MTFGHSVIALTMVVTSLSRADEVSFDGVRERMRRHMADQNVPSIVVTVSRGEKVLWAEALGWADRENRVRATADTPYRIGSTTKPVTATAVMALAERGKLDLDRPVNDYLGDVKVEAYIGDPARATVRAVLQHTSGLPGHWETFFPDEPERPPPVGLLVARYGKLMIPPGERFHYSNIGYTVLGYIVTRRSGKEVADFLREEVFLPLGMTHSFLAVGDTRVPDCAVGYRADSTRVPNISTCVPGAGDIYASANDLLRFGMFHLKGRVAGQKPVLSNA